MYVTLCSISRNEWIYWRGVMQGKQDKGGPAKAEDVVRLYEALMGHVKELSENAARLGGAAGEILLEECTAKVSLAPHPLPDSAWHACHEQISPSVAQQGKCALRC